MKREGQSSSFNSLGRCGLAKEDDIDRASMQLPVNIASPTMHRQFCGASARRAAVRHTPRRHAPRRTFLPNPFIAGSVQRHTERRLLRHPQSAVFAVLAAVDEYAQFVPWCVESRILGASAAPGPRPDRFEAELAVGFQVGATDVSERYVSTVQLVPERSIVARARDSSVFQQLENHWELSPGPAPAECWLDFEVSFQFRSQLYAAFSQNFQAVIVKEMVAAFEKRCDDQAALLAAPLQQQ